MDLNKNTIVISVISLILLVGFLFGVYMLTNTQQQAVFEQTKTVRSDDHVKWSPAKKHILTEYSDLQCPACKEFHDVIKSQIEASTSANVDITKKVTFVYRHFPLYQPHPFADDAAFAAEAAARQDKFFEMVDILFEKQNTWTKAKNVPETFMSYAQDLKLDTEKFKKDMESQEVKDKVNADYVSGGQAGIDSTPTFFLNGQKVVVTSFADFITLLKSLE